jgi:ATPase involved in DNA repair
MIDIPDSLLTQVRDGRVVLFLGSGASFDACDAHGVKPPSAVELAAKLSEKFLGGKYRDYPLNQVAEYAISEADLGTVQAFIREIFALFEPSEGHKLLPKFWWYGLATTNYDQLIEKAYSAPVRLQELHPLIENTDKVEDNLRNPNAVLLLKLHGCISRISTPTCPLILTTDQYVEYRQGRQRLFDILNTWGYEHPIVFIGHSLQDSDIRALLLELSQVPDFRPRYYVIAPDVDEIKSRLWDSRRVTAIKGTFAEFIKALDNAIPTAGRALASLKATVHTTPIAEKFKVKNVALSKVTTQFLEVDVEYINALTGVETIKASQFYKGFNPGFAAIEANLDVRRKLGDTILSDHFLRDVAEPSDGVETIVITAHAGAGKSVLIRRMAWDAAREYDRICLFMKPHGIISAAAIQELISLCKARIFLFVDDAADRVRELNALFHNIGPEGNLLTVVLAERTNEWNSQADSIEPFVTDDYELKYLSTPEIDGLLSLLEKNKALGTLEHLAPDQRRNAFAQRAGRQLLVALHEATLGIPFEEILVNEFNSITPYEAQRIYLTICVLSRLNVPVRAGIIARLHGVPFDRFKKDFFGPLAEVVNAEHDSATRDYVYRARHHHIADIVFMRILSNSEERFDIYVRTLQTLNVAYSADWKAFWEMVRARNVSQLFPNYEMAREIYRIARNSVGDDPHLLHQMGLFEMNRANGSLIESGNLLRKASELAQYDQTIKHSLAELQLRLADKSRTALEREKFFKEATAISLSLIKNEKSDSYAQHTLVKIGLAKLEDSISSEASDSEIERHVKEVQTAISEGLQRFPGDAHLLEADANFAELIAKGERLVSALKRAFEANSRNGMIALRLARIRETAGEMKDALEIVEKAIEANNSDQRLHYAYAKLLMKEANPVNERLLYHLRRAFTDGDSRFDAQLLYGRQLFVKGTLDEFRAVFKRLRTVRVGPDVRHRRMYPLADWFKGRVSRLEASYCFIARDGSGDWIYAHVSAVPEEVWKSLLVGSSVQFQIAFTFEGPTAFNVTQIGSAVPYQSVQMGLFKNG